MGKAVWFSGALNALRFAVELSCFIVIGFSFRQIFQVLKMVLLSCKLETSLYIFLYTLSYLYAQSNHAFDFDINFGHLLLCVNLNFFFRYDRHLDIFYVFFLEENKKLVVRRNIAKQWLWK